MAANRVVNVVRQTRGRSSTATAVLTAAATALITLTATAVLADTATAVLRSMWVNPIIRVVVNDLFVIFVFRGYIVCIG